MESFRFPHCNLVAHVFLYTNVTNASELRKRIVAAATAESDAERDAVNFAFVEARLVTSVQHIQIAIHQAILSQAQGALRTKTVHSEILWVLNPTNNISEAIRRYGVSEDSKSLLVIRIDDEAVPKDEIQKAAEAAVSGEKRPLSDLTGVTDWAAVKKYNKLNAEPAITASKDSPEKEKLIIDNIVTSTVAMKSVV